MAVITQIQLTIKTENPFQAKAKMEYLKKLAELDTETLQKLAELSKSYNAVTQLKNNFPLIQAFLG
jgi:DNA-directed RNA polymerase subunit F